MRLLPEIAALEADWRDVLAAHERAVVFCWAVWSSPNLMFAPVFSRVIPDFSAQFAFFKADLDADELPEFFPTMGVMTNPQLVLIKSGELATRNIGYIREEPLRALLQSWTTL